MEPDEVEETPLAPATADLPQTPDSVPHPPPHIGRDFDWVFIGPHGLRAGWSVLLFAAMYYLFREVIGTLFYAAGLVHDEPIDSAPAVLVSELVPLLSLVAAALIMTLIEDRRIESYNLAGTRRMLHFLSGLAAGFAALSLLVAALACGGWMRLGPASLSIAQAAGIGIVWAVAFLLVAGVEEGLFRCYSLSTLTRGINFWWALAAQIGLCLYLAFTGGGNGAWGVYIAAALGVVPCYIVHQKAAARSAAFWQASWVTSTFFGYYHTANGGENWIGIFAAAFMGFVFCVERPPHRLGMVGSRLPRGVGLGRNLLLRRCRQRHSGPGPLPHRRPRRQSPLERRRRRPRGQPARLRRYSAPVPARTLRPQQIRIPGSCAAGRLRLHHATLAQSQRRSSSP